MSIRRGKADVGQLQRMFLVTAHSQLQRLYTQGRLPSDVRTSSWALSAFHVGALWTNLSQSKTRDEGEGYGGQQ